MTLSENELFEFGVIVGVHGLRGDLKVKALSSHADVLGQTRSVCLRGRDGAERQFSPQRVSQHKGNTLLRLDGVETVEAASELVGAVVLVPLKDLPPLPEGEFYWHQIRGLSVIDRQRGDIGVLEGLFATAAHDIYEVQGRFGEVLIPVVDRFILNVDLQNQRIQVDLPEGLIPEPDED